MQSASDHRPPVKAITVLVVDDEEFFHAFLADNVLKGQEYRVLHAYTGVDCIEILERERVDVVVLDLNLPDGDGFRVLDDMREQGDRAVIIVVTAYANPPSTMRALAAGAWRVLDKGYEDYRSLPEMIAEGIEARARQARRAISVAGSKGGRGLRLLPPSPESSVPTLPRASAFHDLQRLERSHSLAMRSFLGLVRAEAARSRPVLLLGEPGSDRELMAQHLHAGSMRGHAPFVATVARPGQGLASALGPASAESLLATAASGTLFIDQIQHLDDEWQHLILDILSRASGGVGVSKRRLAPVSMQPRIVVGSTVPVDSASAWSALDARLRQAWGGAQLVIPPLRERREDLVSEFEHLLAHTAAMQGVAPPRVTPELAAALPCYEFPHNEQELRAMAVLACARKPGAGLEPHDILPAELIARQQQG
jgi:DNA-binding NtrC family response regulator